ncbi:hypothetical protein, partial [Citrobacter sp. wls718]
MRWILFICFFLLSVPVQAVTIPGVTSTASASPPAEPAA